MSDLANSLQTPSIVSVRDVPRGSDVVWLLQPGSIWSTCPIFPPGHSWAYGHIRRIMTPFDSDMLFVKRAQTPPLSPVLHLWAIVCRANDVMTEWEGALLRAAGPHGAPTAGESRLWLQVSTPAGEHCPVQEGWSRGERTVWSHFRDKKAPVQTFLEEMQSSHL